MELQWQRNSKRQIPALWLLQSPLTSMINCELATDPRRKSRSRSPPPCLAPRSAKYKGTDKGDKSFLVPAVVTYEMHFNFRKTFYIWPHNEHYNAAYPNAAARSVPIVT